MLKGYILDVYPDYKRNMMVTWLINKGKATKVEESYEPVFYVYSSLGDLCKLAKFLNDLPQVKTVDFTCSKTALGSDKLDLVLKVVPKKLDSLSKLAAMVDSWGGFHDYQLFNVDIRLPTRYLNERGVFFNAWTGWNDKRFILEDKQWAIDYEFPSYRTVSLDVKRKNKDRIGSFTNQLESIVVDDMVIEEENEADTLLSAVKHIQQVDPDVIYTANGDGVLFPFLYHRAKLCGVEHIVDFGREQNHQSKNHLQPTKKAKSYFSYGRIIYRPAFYTLKGRVHIDTSNSFLYGESGLYGLVDISRCSNIPLQLLSRLGPGTAISQIQVNKAMKKGFLIPWKKNIPETWKTGWDLLVCDRGGLILEPVVGLHEDIIELDYASLYPNIMLRYNISPETLLCKCCTDSGNRVPQLGYHICSCKKGLIPEVLEPILHRRFCYKARSKNKKYDKDLYTELQKAWKWILLVCFGYTGYRNARYGRIECHESITAYSRDILLTAIETAEKTGYTVLHGIIDSLWVKGDNNCVSPFRLSRIISKETGIRMDVEGRYKWIVFLPSKGTNIGALNRYYGLFEDNTLKARGVELRQHNTPMFLKHLQKGMLKALSKANNAQEFHPMIPSAVEVLLDYGKQLIKEDIELSNLVFTNNVSRDITNFKVNTFVKSALLQLQDIGIHVELGQSVRYIVTNEQSHDYKKRVCIAELLTDSEKVDVDFYLRQIAKCGESLLIPFGYTLEKLQNLLKKRCCLEGRHVPVLQRDRTIGTSF